MVGFAIALLFRHSTAKTRLSPRIHGRPLQPLITTHPSLPLKSYIVIPSEVEGSAVSTLLTTHHPPFTFRPVSPNCKTSANSLNPLDFRQSHSNDTPSIIVIDSNTSPCYPIPCFRRNPAIPQSRHPLTSSPDFSSLCVLRSLSRFCIGQSSTPQLFPSGSTSGSAAPPPFPNRPPRIPSAGTSCGFFLNLQTFQHANLPTFPRRLFSSKPFRISTYEKTGEGAQEGAPLPSASLLFPL
jgi:hypothetical protein